jgi:hypothetical protein
MTEYIVRKKIVSFNNQVVVYNITRSTPAEIVGVDDENYMMMGKNRRNFMSIYRMMCTEMRHRPNYMIPYYDDVEIEYEKYIYLGIDKYIKYKQFYQ